MKNSFYQKGFIQVPILIAIIAGAVIVGGAGVTYAFTEYRDISDKITQADRISNGEKHTEAIALLELLLKRAGWLTHWGLKMQQ
jgi:hypothetical protein